MDKQRLYENIMRDLMDVFSLNSINEDVLDGLDRIGSKTSVEKILDISPIVVRQGGKYIEMQLSDDENKNEIMRLIGDRFYYASGSKDDMIDIDDFLWKDIEGNYKMWLFAYGDMMKKRWCKGRIFATAETKELMHNRWIEFNKYDDKWYAIYSERDENGGRYRNRILDIRQ